MLLAFLEYKCIADDSVAFFCRQTSIIEFEYEYALSKIPEELEFCDSLLNHQFMLYLQVGRDVYQTGDYQQFSQMGKLSTECSASVCQDFSQIRSVAYTMEFRDLNISLEGTVGQYSLKEYDERACWSEAYLEFSFMGDASVELILIPETCVYQNFSSAPSLALHIDGKAALKLPLVTSGDVFMDNTNALYNCSGNATCTEVLRDWIERPFFEGELVMTFPFTVQTPAQTVEFVQEFMRPVTRTLGTLGDDCIQDISVEFYEESFHISYSTGLEEECSLALVEEDLGPVDEVEMRIVCSENSDLTGFRFYQSVFLPPEEFRTVQRLVRCSDESDPLQCAGNLAELAKMADNYSISLQFLFYEAGNAVEKVDYEINSAKECNLGLSVALYEGLVKCIYSVRKGCFEGSTRLLQLQIVFANGDVYEFSYEGPHADEYEFSYGNDFKRRFSQGQDFDHVTLKDGDLETTTYEMIAFLEPEPLLYGLAVFGLAVVATATYLLLLRKQDTL